MPPEKTEPLTLVVDSRCAGQRIDQALAEMLPEFSRSRLQQWIDTGKVRLDGSPCRRRDKVWGGECISLEPLVEPRDETHAEAIPLSIVYEDRHLIVVDKPIDLVVHPAAGNRTGTLQNGLLHHAPELARLPRAGLVHRLDKDTSGLLVVAKTLHAHRSLVEQLQSRGMRREYRALVQGVLVAGDTVDAPIGRHPVHRTRMAVVANGRPSVTHYRIIERFEAHTWLAIRLETGRTHQIRVHMAHIRHPVVGDQTYGGRPRPPPRASQSLVDALNGLGRQALHAVALGLDHPETGERMQFESTIPADIQWVLDQLRQNG